jgi:hypothetical protein
MGVAAERRPGGPLRSDPDRQIVVHSIEAGWHHSDLLTYIADQDAEVSRVRDLEVKQICEWVQQWPNYLM